MKGIDNLPSGKCWNCGAYKQNIYGLCGSCYRFGIPDNELDNKDLVHEIQDLQYSEDDN